MEMHDRYDEQRVPTDLVNDAVWKPIRRAAAGTPRQQGPRLRILADACDGALDFLGELLPKPSTLCIVVRDGFRELYLRWGEKDNVHYGVCFRSTSNTSWAGIVAISPRSKPSRRSSASCAHRVSIC